MSWGVGHRCGLDLALLWLWRRPEATAPIGPVSWHTSICHRCGHKKRKKKKKKKERKKKEDYDVYNYAYGILIGAPLIYNSSLNKMFYNDLCSLIEAFWC